MPSPQKIIDIANAFYQSQTLFSASDLGVFAKLAELGSADAPTLARALELNPRGAELLLNACAAIGLLEKDGASFRNSPDAAAFLVPGGRGDLSKAIRYNRDVYAAWGKAGEFARTGKPVEKPEIHLGDDPARTRAFALSMHGRAMAIGQMVVPLLKLDGCRNLLDVGGGPGAYATLIARANPGITCWTLDLPAISAIAAELVAATEVADRVKTLAGDYHTAEFRNGMDAVIFFGVLHQESPEMISTLFRRAYGCLRPGGKIYVMDMMTDASGTAPEFSALFALNMALTTENGWVFSDDSLKAWLAGAGFTDFQVRPLPAPMPHWLASATKEG